MYNYLYLFCAILSTPAFAQITDQNAAHNPSMWDILMQSWGVMVIVVLFIPATLFLRKIFDHHDSYHQNSDTKD